MGIFEKPHSDTHPRWDIAVKLYIKKYRTMCFEFHGSSSARNLMRIMRILSGMKIHNCQPRMPVLADSMNLKHALLPVDSDRRSLHAGRLCFWSSGKMRLPLWHIDASSSQLRIGEFARRAGVNLQTICYYERMKLLQAAR
jgi:hypothetical protein